MVDPRDYAIIDEDPPRTLAEADERLAAARALPEDHPFRPALIAFLEGERRAILRPPPPLPAAWRKPA